MSHRLLMIHYTPPGIVGGVEQIMRRHASLLQTRGIWVEVVSGRPATVETPLHVIPHLDAAAPANVTLERELACGVVGPLFHDAREHIMQRLVPLVANSDAVIVHNAFTLHFSLPLTAALWSIAARVSPGIPVVAWTHDLSWVNPLYLPTMHSGYPWDLLRVPAPGVQYVTVSQERKDELQQLWGSAREPITLVPNGVDIPALLQLTERARDIVERYKLLERDLVLLLPVRITRRKNIEKAIETTRVLKDRGFDVQLIISGPTALHHPEHSRAYLDELKVLRAALQVQSAVAFLADELGFTLDDADIAGLFSLSDCLILPSASEGFGLPILEAGALGVPAVLSRIPIFREVGGEDATYFSLDDDASTVADVILQTVNTPAARLRRRVRREYRWEVIVDRLILPLLRVPAPVHASPHVVPA